MHELLKKGTALTWDQPQKSTFSTLKSLLTKAPVLAHYGPEKKQWYQWMLAVSVAFYCKSMMTAGNLSRTVDRF